MPAPILLVNTGCHVCVHSVTFSQALMQLNPSLALLRLSVITTAFQGPEPGICQQREPSHCRFGGRRAEGPGRASLQQPASLLLGCGMCGDGLGPTWAPRWLWSWCKEPACCKNSTCWDVHEQTHPQPRTCPAHKFHRHQHCKKPFASPPDTSPLRARYGAMAADPQCSQNKEQPLP